MSSVFHPKKERSMIPLFLTVFIDMLGLGIAIPVLAVIFLDPKVSILPAYVPYGLRTIGYGLLIASYPLAQFFGAPILGALSDRYGRKPILVLSLFGTALGYALFGIGIQWHHIPLLFASRLLDGFTGGNLSIAFSAIADISKGQAKTRNFGLIGMAFGLGFILGPYVGAKLADSSLISWFSLSTPFWMAAFLTLVNVLLCLWIFQETLLKRSETVVSPLTGFRNLLKAFTLTEVRSVFLVSFLMTLGFNLFTQFFQIFLIERYQFSLGDIGDFSAYVGLWLAFTQGLLTRPVSRRLSPKAIFAWSSLLLGFSFPLLLFPEGKFGLYGLAPLLAIFQGFSATAITTIVSDLSGDDSQGEVMGINQSIQSLAMTIPPIIGGFVASVHASLPIYAACILTLIGCGIFIWTFRGRRVAKHVMKGIHIF